MNQPIKANRATSGSELNDMSNNFDNNNRQLGQDDDRAGQVDADLDVDIWADYDPAVVLASMRRAAGSWSDMDADALKEELYRARELGSRPSDRP